MICTNLGTLPHDWDHHDAPANPATTRPGPRPAGQS
jgi:hypothetical protein